MINKIKWLIIRIFGKKVIWKDDSAEYGYIWETTWYRLWDTTYITSIKKINK